MLEPSDKIWMDERFLNWNDANVHVLTHSLHYGLAAFEGIRCYKARIARRSSLRDHVDRLFDSAHISMLTVPYDKTPIMTRFRLIAKASGKHHRAIRFTARASPKGV